MPKEIAIVGTRNPGPRQAELAALMAKHYVNAGNYIVTGGAFGIDSIVIQNSVEAIIYLPWKPKPGTTISNHHYLIFENFPYAQQNEAASMVVKYHPDAKHLAPAAWKLHGRNWFIVKGRDRVIAFPNETKTGGTGMAIAFAQALGVETLIYTEQDLKNDELFESLKKEYA